MNPNIPGFGPISAQFGNALSFERRLEHAHSIDSTFGKYVRATVLLHLSLLY